MMRTILEVKDLYMSFKTYRGEVKALNGVSLKIYEGEVLALVGESGCGKSVTALSILGLLPENAMIKKGEILFKGDDLLKKSKEEMRRYRAYELASIFQDPMTYLNPVLSIETQLLEVIMMQKDIIHEAIKNTKESRSIDIIKLLDIKASMKTMNEKVPRRLGKEIARKIAIEILKLVRLPDPERILKAYPFELSGGMRQRVMIAMALIRRPSLLVADEITTALDVTVQAQILHLLKDLKDKVATSTLFITHDLSVAAEVADRIAVMYAGRIAEVAPVRKIFRNPLHPYTKLLLRAIPNIEKPSEKLEHIPGTVPDLVDPPPGCRFHPRCPYAMDICKTKIPMRKEVEKDHEVECFLYQ